MAESAKRERFTKVASNRVQNVLHYLNLLKNCANKGNYEYTQDDVDKMFNEISRVLKEVKTVYASEQNKQNSKGFTF